MVSLINFLLSKTVAYKIKNLKGDLVIYVQKVAEVILSIILIRRFIYRVTLNFKGAFLIPYFITLFIIAIPLMYMEFSVGQFTRRGPIGALSQLCPFFKGVGIATVVISFWLTTYYIIIIGWDTYFLKINDFRNKHIFFIPNLEPSSEIFS